MGATREAGVSGTSPPDFALEFIKGEGDYVDIVNSRSLHVTGRNITMTAWVYPRDGGANGGSRMISKMNNAGNGDVFAMQIDKYRLRFRLDNVDMISHHIVQLDEWVHVAMVYDGIDKRIYINGSLEEDLQNNPLSEAKTDPIDASAAGYKRMDQFHGSRPFRCFVPQITGGGTQACSWP